MPEPKTVKNRIHLDINAQMRSTVGRWRSSERLMALGGTVLRNMDERGESWIVMQDPEGNDFRSSDSVLPTGGSDFGFVTLERNHSSLPL